RSSLSLVRAICSLSLTRQDAGNWYQRALPAAGSGRGCWAGVAAVSGPVDRRGVKDGGQVGGGVAGHCQQVGVGSGCDPAVAAADRAGGPGSGVRVPLAPPYARQRGLRAAHRTRPRPAPLFLLPRTAWSPESRAAHKGLSAASRDVRGLGLLCHPALSRAALK